MKILFTGGGSGGHFYPIVSIIDAIREVSVKERLIDPEIYYMSTTPYDPALLYDNKVKFIRVYAGKQRRYFSLLNYLDIFKTFFGIIKAFFAVYRIFPDVVVSKGGYASFPVLVAARFFGIPVVIHESDIEPGRVNKWASKFAKKIAISWPEAGEFFPKNKTAWTGNPIRKGIMHPLNEGALEYLRLTPGVPIIFILGGSQGAEAINETIIDSLPELLTRYQIIHQTGNKNFENVRGLANAILKDNKYKDRYKPFAYLNELAMRMAAGSASLVISRAGSTIFEIASWSKASIIIPIPEKVSHDQEKNAFAYSKTGSCSVIRQINLKPNILIAEIDRILNDNSVLENMAQNASNFAKKDAAEKIAVAVLDIAIQHEK